LAYSGKFGSILGGSITSGFDDTSTIASNMHVETVLKDDDSLEQFATPTAESEDEDEWM